MSSCFRKRLSLMLLEHQDVIAKFCSLSWRKELSKETSSGFICVPRVVQPVNVVCPQTPQRLTKVIPLITTLEFVFGNSLFAMQGDKFETIFQTRSGHELSSVRLNMETLAPRLWIDLNVVDCWVAILNHEELVKGCTSLRSHFFPTGCITQAMIEGSIDEKDQWKVFSAEISTQFKHDISSISLSEVDLAFFPICASDHFYVVVFHIKKQVSMIILDNSDCGETYNSKYKAVCEPLSYVGQPVAKWDVGLCAKSEEQVSLLRRMRFKIATKILLRELNVHAQKMFDLAYKFETKNDEQTRILIIVDAIKNRAERDPTKTKTVVKNQDEDAVKSK
ncbi:ulp1 protease family, C-terminal catalytic domain-containing protein [Tanacetum coccineum]